MEQHIHLTVLGSRTVEPVHVESAGKSSYRILYSPGLVLGIAAGDVVELLDDNGQFRVISRGGNIAVQMFSKTQVSGFKGEIEEVVNRRLKGRLDGETKRTLVFTISAACGFPAIEEVFEGFVSAHRDVEWIYGNVFDPETNEPLGWWNERT